MKKLITFLLAIVLTTLLNANNITVSNVILTGQNTSSDYTLVQFDISWENSWRTSSAPSNWDAAWVFVKYRVLAASGGDGLWHHASLNDDGHTTPAGSIIDIGLLTPATAFNSTANPGLGAFIYRGAVGTGTFTKTGAQLRWNYGVNYKTGSTPIGDNDIIDIQVYAIEMVYVPQGAFTVGSGGTESGSFTDGSWSTGATIALSIASESALTIANTAGNLWGTSSSGDNTIGGTGTLAAAFPKGYNAFYCMKYEISQQGYVDFLNTLTFTQQQNRTNNATPPYYPAGTYMYDPSSYRSGIKISTSGTDNTVPAIYATDYPYVTSIYFSWADLAAYLDWSGLRPMTELEFEKSCRGTLAPVLNEYAWGNTNIATLQYTLSNSGESNEVIATNYNSTYGNAAFGSTFSLPVRVGIFAGTSGNTGRITAGATYYGIMEMSGNSMERCVTLGNTTGRAFTGAHGDGNLNATGNATASAWPGTDAVGAGSRGGAFYTASYSETYLQVSNRYFAALTYGVRYWPYCGRGVRGAPVFGSVIGDTYGGGIIFYIDGTGQHGLIAAASDQSAAIWGCYGTLITGADGAAIGTGNQNTIAIEAGCTTPGIAADICANLSLNGYDDWYLPSKDELNELYINRAVVGGFIEVYYWSSTQNGNWYAWEQAFTITFSQYSDDKIHGHYVRAIRSF